MSMSNLTKSIKEFFPRTRTFLTEVRGEWKKVTKPPRREVMTTTAVVLVTSFVFAVYLWISDRVIQWVYEETFKLLGL
ncbi:MAG TPA: preprotein translocase subunit SecE [Thermoanaerobaculia bacterium]|jgi:preprotein translocase SecE subunit